MQIYYASVTYKDVLIYFMLDWFLRKNGWKNIDQTSGIQYILLHAGFKIGM